MGATFLVLQVAWLAQARWVPQTAPELTPTAGRTSYHIHVSVEGRMLSDREIRRRYHLAERDRVGLTPDLLKSVIRRVEQQHGESGASNAWVRLHLRHNGADPEVWLWPEE